MRVIVIGAGIGGLTLAQGLRREGIDVAVHDRDAEPSDTGGFRLHLNARAREVLARRLPPALLQAVLASAAGGSTFRRFAFCDHRLRVLVSERQPDDERLMIGRIPLRELLVHGLDDAVRFGSRYAGHRVGADGRVTAEFDDGSTDVGDVLVGADGARSGVVRELAGRSLSRPTGVTGVAGRVGLDDETRALLPDVLRAGPALAIGPGGVGAFLTLHDPSASPIDPATCTDVAARPEEPYLLWAPGMPDGRFQRPPGDLDGHGLIELATGLFRGWPDPFRELVARSDPATVGCFPFRAADPDADPAPWRTGTVTALGDAVHAMPPTGGRGAATAMRDADALVTHLAAAAKGAVTVPVALHDYEREMAAWGPAEVRESLRPLAWQLRMSHPLAYRAGRIGLAAAGVRGRRRDRVLERPMTSRRP